MPYPKASPIICSIEKRKATEELAESHRKEPRYGVRPIVTMILCWKGKEKNV